jgi:hypothetical protein
MELNFAPFQVGSCGAAPDSGEAHSCTPGLSGNALRQLLITIKWFLARCAEHSDFRPA